MYKGREMTSRELGVTTAAPIAPKVTARHKKSKFLEQKELSYMSWNAGSLTTAVWEELLSILRTPPYRLPFRKLTGEAAGSSQEMVGT